MILLLTAEGANEGAVMADPLRWIWPWNRNVLHQKNTWSHCTRSSRDTQRRTVDALFRCVLFCLCVYLCVCICTVGVCCSLYMYVYFYYRCSTWHDLSPRVLRAPTRGVYGQQFTCMWWDWERSAPLPPGTPSISEWHRNLCPSPRPDCLCSPQPQNWLLPGIRTLVTLSFSFLTWSQHQMAQFREHLILLVHKKAFSIKLHSD